MLNSSRMSKACPPPEPEEPANRMVSGQSAVTAEGLLVFAPQGMMSVTTGDNLWALAPHRGL
ncbi:MAG: hypothetical protein JSR98_18035, partial [Proteobacteria bacterium]|nr:hypothetical protein [Pseudomonadota bacterium]